MLSSFFAHLVERAGLKRRHLEAPRLLAERQCLALFHPSVARPHGRILAYHSIGQPAFGVNDVAPERFRRQIELALQLGYRFVCADSIAKCESAPKDLAITFDDGCKSVLTQAAPVLKDYSIPFTVFVVTDWPLLREPWQRESLMCWADLETLCATGVNIGSHSATHCDFGRIDPARAREELLSSRETIFRRLGITTDLFAIPLGLSKNWNSSAQQAAQSSGYAAVFAQSEVNRPPGTVARSFVSRYDDASIFRAMLTGAHDNWEEWVCAWGN